MYLKLVPLFFLSLVNGIVLEESYENGFTVVSTTQGPSQLQQLDNRLTELEYKFTNNSHLLEAMNLQIQQIQKSLELNQLQSVETKHCLEAMKLQNQSIQKTLAKNKEFQKMLEDITSTNQRMIEKNNSKDQVQPLPKNCLEVKNRGSKVSKVYWIQPQSSANSFSVWCDMETDGGGWAYLLNRYDGSQNFDLNWFNYKHGFGNLQNEHWLGLKHLYALTANEVNELLIELVDWDLTKVYVRYTSFSIGNEDEGYQIKVINGFSGDVHDDLSFDIGIKFSTKDKDQDPKSDSNCAAARFGGWWYNNWCSDAKLTGHYAESIKSALGMYWWGVHENFDCLKSAKMMIKPRN